MGGKREYMKKGFFYKYIAVTLFGMCVLTGCGSEEKEAKATYRQMGIEYMEQGDYASAIEAFDTALSQEVGIIGANELDIAYYKAAAQYAGGDIEAAFATYNAIIDFEKNAYEAYYLRGCLYCKQGNVEAAKADFAKAVQIQDSDYELYINIYENLSLLEETEEAEGYLNQAMTINGEEVMNHEYRGQIYYLLGEYDNAIEELNQAVEAGSTYANLYLAKSYEDKGDPATAEGYFKAYIAAVPADAVALNELGEIMLEKERYAEAVLYFEQGLACEVISNTRALMHNLVVAYEYNGEFDKAWEIIQQYVSLFPGDEEAEREYIFLKNRQMKEEPVEEPESIESTENIEELS